MASVQLRNVTKAWGDVVVSKDINLDIHEGEFVVFVGPSGCGKSTLLRMIAGLETITSGDLLIGDTRMNDIPPAERGVGMVFQSYALYPHLSVAENMSFGLKLAGAKKDVINQRVTQVAEVLQLAHLLERKPKALSGGQRRRADLARLLLKDWDILALDEPTNHLDMLSKEILENAINSYEGTVLYVSHDRYFLDRVVRRIFSFEENGGIDQYEGGYTDYINRKKEKGLLEENALLKTKSSSAGKSDSDKTEKEEYKIRNKKLKFSYNEQREYETIEDDIAKLEEKIEKLDGEIVKNATNSVKLRELMESKEETETLLMEKMDRWEYLEDLAKKIEEQ